MMTVYKLVIILKGLKMKSFVFSIVVLIQIVILTDSWQPVVGQESAGSGLSSALFELREMDMHIHAGKELEIPLDKWIDLSVKDGRKVMVLLDHLELYRVSKEENKNWTEERKFQDWYPVAAKGHSALMNDLSAAEQRTDVITFRGWEIYEGEMDTGIEAEPMTLAEVIGWHISPNNGRKAPDGQTLLKRAAQIIALQKEFPIPMILFHPFSMRIENLQRTAQKSGRDITTISAEEYRFFQTGEQEALIELLHGKSVYIEISHGLAQYWEDEVVRQAVMEDIRPLVEGGLEFTVSTDAHGVRSFNKPFDPGYYCNDLGVTPENTNTLVRELLAIRAKRNLSPSRP
jgi:hypothetical protein